MTPSSSTTPTSTPAWPTPEAEAFMRGLARMVAPDRPEEAEASLFEMLKVLRDVPQQAWRSRSCLEAVATARDRGIPSFAQIRKAISDWTKRHPQPTDPTPADKAGLGGEDGYWLNFWNKRSAEIDAEGGPMAAARRRTLASLVRTYSPAAWRVASGGEDIGRPVPLEADHEAVRERVEALTAEMEARGLDGTSRSHSFGEQVAALGAGVRPGPVRGQLTAEQLAADRAKRGIATA